MATETASTGRESDKFMLRFPAGMRDLVKEAAEKNGRTMNSEVIARLQASFDTGTDVHNIEKIEASARAIGYKPGTDAFEGAVDALKAEIRELLDQQTEQLLSNIVAMDKLKRTNPLAFQAVLALSPESKSPNGPSKKTKTERVQDTANTSPKPAKKAAAKKS